MNDVLKRQRRFEIRRSQSSSNRVHASGDQYPRAGKPLLEALPVNCPVFPRSQPVASLGQYSKGRNRQVRSIGDGIAMSMLIVAIRKAIDIGWFEALANDPAVPGRPSSARETAILINEIPKLGKRREVVEQLRLRVVHPQTLLENKRLRRCHGGRDETLVGAAQGDQPPDLQV